MLLLALTPAYTDGGTISTKLAGVVLASLSSGGGELSFLGLVHFYGPFSLAAWGSGTGGAGLIGAGAYALATTTFGFGVKPTLLASSLLPIVMLISFFIVLPLGPLKAAGVADLTTAQVVGDDGDDVDTDDLDREQRQGLLADDRSKPSSASVQTSAWGQFMANLRRARVLFWPFMLPLLVVYIAEYVSLPDIQMDTLYLPVTDLTTDQIQTINQGVAPDLLFPVQQSPFKHYRAFYPTYNAIYQAGVFISRSSTPFFRIHNLYFPSILQIANLAILTAHAMYDFFPNVYIIFVIIFWEGLLGGLVYVNTFAEISDTIPKQDREFSLSATTVSDSGGICIAGLASMAFEVWLCNWQIQHGRDYCTKT